MILEANCMGTLVPTVIERRVHRELRSGNFLHLPLNIALKSALTGLTVFPA
jgi:hypothetical protein